MGYFDGVVDANFKTTKEGTILFYPDGVLGKGYVVPNIQRKEEMRKHLKRFNILSMVVAIGSASSLYPLVNASLIPWWIAALVCLLCVVSITVTGYVVSRRLIKELVPVSRSLTVTECYRNSAKSHHVLGLLIIEVFSILLVLGGLQIASDTYLVWHSRLIGLFSVLFFGTSGVTVGYMIKTKLKN